MRRADWIVTTGLLACTIACGADSSDRNTSNEGTVPSSPAGSSSPPSHEDVPLTPGTDSGTGEAGSASGDAGAKPTTRAANAERYAHAQCVGGLGLHYRGGKDPGTGIGGYFGRYPKPRTCQTRSVGNCTSLSCPGDSSPTSLYRGGISYSSSVGSRFVGARGDGYATGTTNQPLLPPVGETVGIELRSGSPTARAFDLPAPGDVAELVAPLKKAKVARAAGVHVSWVNGAVLPSSTVLVTLTSPMQRIECLVNASAASLDVPAALTADVPVGEVDITVEAASERFDDDDDCVVRTLLTRVPTPVWTPVIFE